MRDDPIDELVEEWPTAAVLYTPDDASEDYDPGQEDEIEGGPSSPVVGFYSSQVEAGAGYSAKLVLRHADAPAHLRALRSRARVGANDYLVTGVTERRWEGRPNGYELELKL